MKFILDYRYKKKWITNWLKQRRPAVGLRKSEAKEFQTADIFFNIFFFFYICSQEKTHGINFLVSLGLQVLREFIINNLFRLLTFFVYSNFSNKFLLENYKIHLRLAGSLQPFVIFASPVSHPFRVLHSCLSSGPAAR